MRAMLLALALLAPAVALGAPDAPPARPASLREAWVAATGGDLSLEGTLTVHAADGPRHVPMRVADFLARMDAALPAQLAPVGAGVGVGVDDPSLRALVGWDACATLGFWTLRDHSDAPPPHVAVAVPPARPDAHVCIAYDPIWGPATQDYAVLALTDEDFYDEWFCAYAMVWQGSEPSGGALCNLRAVSVHGEGTFATFTLGWHYVTDVFLGRHGAVEAVAR